MITINLFGKKLLLKADVIWTSILTSFVIGYINFAKSISTTDYWFAVIFVMCMIINEIFKTIRFNSLNISYTEDTTLNTAENIRKFVADDASDILYSIKPTIDCDETDVDYMVILNQ